MTLREELPHFRAICRDSSVWFLPLSEKDSFLAAWTDGKAFWNGIGLWEEPVTIKLADITGAVVRTEASIALRKEEEAEIANRKVLSGE